ncbi:disease resistance protein (TIR-NBS-LRR class) [Trifolium pratense]|uniref:Disease resistance protein (TIR-NBS-LRR class) n=2 Tax=Trifolium pratense TaxID=57577 RepID=A0A2K3PI90_TRIPR|nr:disease resistance protein (TIR-NBS-LRR class) [Trifolium pratense]
MSSSFSFPNLLNDTYTKNPSKTIRIHDVFLSFRGEDTRVSFTSHLNTSLLNAGIKVFRDDDSLQRGDIISTSISRAIEQSQIAVIVFSKNYADSRWCLDELVKIMECSKSTGQVILPVFYGVDPSEVRHQNGEFGRAFQSLLTRLSNMKGLFKVLNFKSGSLNLEQERSWTAALHEVAGFAGFVVLNSRNESEAIKDIVEKVVRLLNKTDLFVANNPVGVEPRVEDMIQLLEKRIPQHTSELLQFQQMQAPIQLLQFQPGQAPLQPLHVQPMQAPVQPLQFQPVQAPFHPLQFQPMQALVQQQQFQPVQAPVQQQQFQQMQAPNLQSKDVLLIGMWGMGGIGKTTIAKAIFNKIGRNFDGRSFLANIREAWEQNIGQVSLQERILFDICKETTNKIQSIEEGKNKLKDRLYHKKVLLVLDDVNTLDQLNALCGSRQWFGSGSRIIITTRDMHILRGNRVDQVYTMKEMGESEAIELFSWHAFKQASPNVDFAEISRNVVDYSGGLPLALEVLGSYLFDRGITEWESVLEKLKKIPNDQVHKKLKISYDALNDDTEKEIFLDIACFFIGMVRNDVIHILNGCELYAEIGINVLVERSLVTVDDMNRLGMHDLLRDMGREIIREKSPKDPEERSRLWFSKDVLDVLSEQTGTKVVEGLTLKLQKADAKCFTTKAFKNMTRLRLLQLVGVQLDGDFEYLSRNLRWISWNGFPLTCIPTSFYLGNLVSIELVNSNVEFLWIKAQRMEKLKILNLSHSHSLRQTPDFSNMPNLEKLILTDCPMLSEISPSIGHLNEIDKLEDELEDMKSLTTLIANNTAIARVPFSVVRSKSIGYISLCGYEGFSHDVFPAIIWSWMSPTNNLPSPFQSPAGISSLVPLDVQNSSSHELSSISNYLQWLRCLLVECDSELQLSRDTKIILDALYASNSKELESTATSQVSNVKTSALIQCYSQVSNVKSLFIQIGMNCQVTKILKDIILQNMAVKGCGGQLLPGDSYPDWLTFNFKGSSVIFEVPRVQGRNLKTMVCVIYSSTPDNIASDGLKNVLVKNYTKATIQLYKREALVSFEDEDGERVVSSIEPGNKVEVVVVFENSFVVKETIVYLVYDEPIGEKIEKCQEQEKNDIVYSGDDNEGIVWTSSPPVELVDENGSAASCCGLIKYSFRQWITDLVHKLVECR